MIREREQMESLMPERREQQGPSVRDVDGTIRVLIVDDHKILRDGLKASLGYESDMTVVGEAANGEEAIRYARELQPDVIVMDVSMPVMNGIDATRVIAQEMPQTRVIVLSMLEENSTARRAREAGAEAFLSKDGASEDLFRAIRGE